MSTHDAQQSAESDYTRVTAAGFVEHTRIVGERPMFHPGKCRWCGSIYDGGAVEVTARYADCSVWKAPCCGNSADDRPQGWGGSFFPLSHAERKQVGV
ncbi:MULTISPECIES: hypothetical protein [unclassified Nocardioides]|uniref:hypothetical protein n=1 Tax=unclassified Nocardioides TaxID=2615069 RepID=UPI0009EFD48F|nr:MULTISPECIES: hypothetical protein [unclassified Nocardioides]GAW50587.1 hypothetical protein PD653B2_2923 [Nocardioides sp. PD653-B2]GAW57472.1 hypothetical protein PD653_4917 [Nocardioides sp. PD653]